MDLPKKARTADWQDGFLILDGEKKIKVPELSIELMERLAGFSLVGFHVKNYPFNDDLLKPFFGHRSMVNFGVENGNLTDACFPFSPQCPNCVTCFLTGMPQLMAKVSLL